MTKVQGGREEGGSDHFMKVCEWEAHSYWRSAAGCHKRLVATNVRLTLLMGQAFTWKEVA